MQTFLPYPSFRDSLACLDNKRLGKQRVEAYQILNAIIEERLNPGKYVPWSKHPAVVMWKKCELGLLTYTTMACEEWTSRGFADTVYGSITRLFEAHQERLGYGNYTTNYEGKYKPWWLNHRPLHISHQAMLYKKDPIHYLQFQSAFDELSGEPSYIWPMSKYNIPLIDEVIPYE